MENDQSRCRGVREKPLLRDLGTYSDTTNAATIARRTFVSSNMANLPEQNKRILLPDALLGVGIHVPLYGGV